MLDELVFDADLVQRMRVPQTLVIHVVDVYNDCVRYAAAHARGFCADSLKALYLPVVRFATEVSGSRYPELLRHIQEDLLNDFTDCQYGRDESLARFLERSEDAGVDELDKGETKKKKNKENA